MTFKANNEKTEKTITDDTLDELAKEYESGSWDGKLGKVVIGRPSLADEEVKPVTFRLPISKIAAVDEQAKSKGENRSDYLRGIIDDALGQA